VSVFSCKSGAVLCMPCEILHDSQGVSAWLSERLGLPVIELHFLDDVVWGYALYKSGREVDRYSSMPNYWEKLAPEELKRQAGDASVVAAVWPGVTVEEIAGYLTNKEVIPEADWESRAYLDDQFPVSDAWQLCDFMKKLGLDYPFDEDGDQETKPIMSIMIATPNGLVQKDDFEKKSEAIQEELRRYREQQENQNG